MANLFSNISAIAPYYGTSTVLVSDHTVPDIMNGLMYKHAKEGREYDKFSQKFWKGNPQDTARGLFGFCRQNIRYIVELPDDQTVKSPGAITYDRFGDCKHYASFINGVLDSLKRKGYPVGQPVYRFAGYHMFSNDLHHVFAVLKTPQGEYWIDPVLPTFNNRKIYFAHEDKAAAMPLREISGFGYQDDANVGGFFDKIKDAVKKVEHGIEVNTANIAKGVKVNTANIAKGVKVNTANIAHGVSVDAQNLKKGINITAHNIEKGAANTAKAVKSVALKVVGAAPRNAFLALLKANAFNMAHRLYDFIHSNKANENEVYAKWQSLGGEPNKIKTAITDGMRAYAFRNKFDLGNYNKQHNFISGFLQYNTQMPAQQQHYMYVICTCFPYHMAGLSDNRRSIGFDPGTVTALMTAAAAIIAAFATIFGKAKWGAEDKKNAEAAVDAGAQLLSNQAATVDSGTIATGTVSNGDGTVTPTLAATVSTDADGNKTIDLSQTDALANAAADKGDSVSDQLSEAWNSVKAFFSEYKTPLLIVTAVGVGYKLMNTHSTPKKRR